MTCRQIVPDVVDHARGVALDGRRLEAVTDHLHSCASCAALSERERAMSQALRRLANDQAPAATRDRALQQLLARFDAPRARPRRMTPAVGFALAASILIVAGLSVGWKAGAPLPASPLVAPAAADAGFVMLAGASALPRFEHGEVIRVEVSSPEGPVEADVLVGQDGLARAIRFVN